MTEVSSPQAQVESLPVQPDEATASLIRQGIEQVQRGKTTLADLFQAMAHPKPAVPSNRAVAVPQITEEQRAALAELPTVYGKVVPTSPRKLTLPELQAIVKERDLIDTILGFLEKRKKDSIRETLSTHFDKVCPEPEEGKPHRLDNQGHLAVKQEIPVEGTGRKIQRIVSGGKPRLTIQAVEKALGEGLLDRKTYLKITRKPDNPRVLDENGIAEAIKKDPALLFVLGSLAEETIPTTSIKVADDK